VHHDIIRLQDVTVRYGSRPALIGVTARIPCGSLTAVVGPNGAGKSTLLRAILGWVPLAAGEIRIGDHHAHHALPRLAYVPQRFEVDWDFPITVRGVVAQGRYPALGSLRRFSPEDHALVDRALAEMDLTELQDRQISALSGGQQQRVFLARALAQGADIFLLDEPFANLDVASSDELADQLRSWEEQGRTVVAVLHDLPLARRAFSHALLLDGRLIAEGPVNEVLAPERVAEAFRGGSRRRPTPAPSIAA
jgi:ABC-type Mn2+/Zn2+ transport system ATPase subunit